jgi:hypothetical protein
VVEEEADAQIVFVVFVFVFAVVGCNGDVSAAADVTVIVFGVGVGTISFGAVSRMAAISGCFLVASFPFEGGDVDDGRGRGWGR